MASYKVPQDVEADDKLIGPFSFRQFIYLIIVAAACAIAFFLSKLFIGLIIIPLPVIVFFGALALPLKKDQPMETYLAAIVSFYIKPRRRLWSPDGIQSLIQITVPKVVEVQRTKQFGQDEAERRLSYLANVVDSHGWSVRGVQQPDTTSMNADVYNEAQQAEDILDNSGRTAANIQNQLGQSNSRHREELVARMHQPQPAQIVQPPTAQQITSASSIMPQISDPYANLGAAPSYNPYPTMHQSVIQPAGNSSQQAVTAVQPQPTVSTVLDQTAHQTTSEKPISADIMNLANNRDLSIETIAHEANRIKQKEEAGLPKDEVVISLH